MNGICVYYTIRRLNHNSKPTQSSIPFPFSSELEWGQMSVKFAAIGTEMNEEAATYGLF